jgi:hypothetical protein
MISCSGEPRVFRKPVAAAAWHTTDVVDPSMVFMIRAARSGMVKQTCEVCVFQFD